MSGVVGQVARLDEQDERARAVDWYTGQAALAELPALRKLLAECRAALPDDAAHDSLFYRIDTIIGAEALGEPPTLVSLPDLPELVLERIPNGEYGWFRS